MFTLSGGRVGARMVGNDVGVLTTTGRKSGQQRATPLFIYRDAEDWIVVASNGGTATPPAWLLNLQTDPAGTLRDGRTTHPVRAEILSAAEKADWWPRVTSRYKGYESYQSKTDRDIPLVRLRRVAG